MFEDLKNSIDFFLSNATRFSRKNFIEKNPKIIERTQSENDYTFDILSRYLKPTTKPNIKSLDIGSKNWFYAEGEYRFLNNFSNDFILDGVELDAYRLYINFYSRFETAKFHIKELKNTNYIAGNLLDINKKYDYIFWFLPFVFIEPLVKWKLPKRCFCPEKLLKHAYSLLEEAGQMLIINQGELEADEQKKLLEKLSIPYQYLGEIQSSYFEYTHKRFGFLVNK